MGSSADNSLTTPLVFSIPRLVDSRTQDKDQVSPQAIPVTVSAVTAEGKIEVKAEMKGNFTLPKMTIGANYGEWNRPAVKVGDKGYVLLGDYYTGGQTNLGGGTASYRGEGRANLTTSIFHPVSNTKFASNANRNMNASLLSGPQGAVINDSANKTVVTVNGSKISVDPGPGQIVYLGGDGVTGTYDFVSTPSGTSINVKARTR